MASELNAEAVGVVAIITKLKVGFTQSLLGMFTVAVLTPILVGVSVMIKPVVPLVTEVSGKVVTLNCAALGPVKLIVLMLRVPVPAALYIENVREALVPKLVLFSVLVEVLIGTLLPFPVKLKLAVGATAVVKSFAMLLGDTQLFVVPVNAAKIKDPVQPFPVASVTVVMAVFDPEGIP